MSQIALQEQDKSSFDQRISFREGFRRFYEAGAYGVFVFALGAGLTAILPANHELVPVASAVAVAAGGITFLGKYISGPSY